MVKLRSTETLRVLLVVPPDTSVLAKIVPIHNSNAIGISSLTYNDNTKAVTFFSKLSYSRLEDQHLLSVIKF